MSGAGEEKDEDRGEIQDTADFLNHAYVIECEAQERYQDLGYQMALHNNHEVAALFHKLARIEGEHAREIKERLDEAAIPERAPWDFDWNGFESPEAADPQDLHYLMTPYHALEIALKAEQRAYEFFARIAKTAEAEEIRHLADEFAREEKEHIDMVRGYLVREPKPDPNWDEDWDPPNVLE